MIVESAESFSDSDHEEKDISERKSLKSQLMEIMKDDDKNKDEKAEDKETEYRRKTSYGPSALKNLSNANISDSKSHNLSNNQQTHRKSSTILSKGKGLTIETKNIDSARDKG